MWNSDSIQMEMESPIASKCDWENLTLKRTKIYCVWDVKFYSWHSLFTNQGIYGIYKEKKNLNLRHNFFLAIRLYKINKKWYSKTTEMKKKTLQTLLSVATFTCNSHEKGVSDNKNNLISYQVTSCWEVFRSRSLNMSDVARYVIFTFIYFCLFLFLLIYNVRTKLYTQVLIFTNLNSYTKKDQL